MAGREVDVVSTRLAERMAALTVGPGTDDATQVGPLVNEEAAAKVDELVTVAVAAGAAELVATITDREIGHVLTPDREVATVDPVDEAAVRKPAHRKRQKATK